MDLSAEALPASVPDHTQVPLPFGDVWYPSQSRFLIPLGENRRANEARIGMLAERTGLSRRTLCQLQHAVYPVPLHTALAIAHAQNDFSLLRLYLGRVRRGLVQAPRLAAPPQGDFFRHLAFQHTEFFEQIEKLGIGEPLSEDDQARLEDEAETIKAEIDAIVEYARALREKARVS